MAEGVLIRGFHGLTHGDFFGRPRFPLYLAYARDLAEAYADGDDGCAVVEVRAQLLNPLVLDSPTAFSDAIIKSRCVSDPHPNWHPSATGQFCAWASEQGYDSVLIPPEAGFDSLEQEEWELASGTFGEPQVILLSPKSLRIRRSS